MVNTRGKVIIKANYVLVIHGSDIAVDSTTYLNTNNLTTILESKSMILKNMVILGKY